MNISSKKKISNTGPCYTEFIYFNRENLIVDLCVFFMPVIANEILI